MVETLNSVIRLLNGWGDAHWSFAVAMFLQVSILVAVLLCIDRFLRYRVRAVVRYAMWMLVPLKLMLPVSLCCPASIGYWLADDCPGNVNVGVDLAELRWLPMPAEIPARPDLALQPRSTDPSRHVPRASPTVGDAEKTTAEPLPLATEKPAPVRLEQVHWTTWLLAVWLVTVGGLLGILVRRTLKVRRVVHQADEAPAALEQLLTESRALVQLRGGRVRLKVSDQLRSPAICGLWRPTVLLPRRLLDILDQQQLRMVFVHELVHRKRYDVQVNCLQAGLQIVYFYNPAVWIANAILRRLREQAVDEAVLVALGSEKETYTATLLDTASALSLRSAEFSLQLVGILESKKALVERVRRIVTRPVPKKARLGLVGIAAIVLLGTLLLPMAGDGRSVAAIQGNNSGLAGEQIAGITDQAADALSAAYRAEHDPIGDQAALDGTWTVTSVAMGGQNVPQSTMKGFAFSFAGDILALQSQGRTVSVGTYALDRSKQPPMIDMWGTHQLILGIYSLADDELRLCLNESGQGRPRGFDRQEAASADVLLVLRRTGKRPNAEVFRQVGMTAVAKPETPHSAKRALFVMNRDGTGWRPLLSMPEYTAIGCPAWSRDGTKIAFDAWRPVRGENYTNAHVFTVHADGSAAKDLGPGARPSWSPDGRRIVFSQYDRYRGVWIMNHDGSGRELIDPEGWASQWSPAGEKIAYTRSFDGKANLCVQDLKTKQLRPLLDTKYRVVYWGLTWSPDGDGLCFKGVDSDGRPQIAVVPAEGEKKGLQVLTKDMAPAVVSSIENCLAWGGDGDEILVFMKTETDRARRLYALDAQGNKPPKPVARHDPTRGDDTLDMAWSPDGKHIVVSRAVLAPDSAFSARGALEFPLQGQPARNRVRPP